MKTLLGTIQLLSLLAASASAQLVTDGGTATINGVTTNLAGSLTVGTNSGNTTLILTNGGQVNSDGGAIGSGASSSSNIVFITGPGSVWSNYPNALVFLGVSGAGNRLIVTNGGALVGRIWFGSGFATSSNNSMVVTGPGSEVRAGELFMGVAGARNQLTIENGARVNADYVTIGSTSGPRSTNNTLRVTDGGLLLITNLLEMGGLSRNNQLIIANGGKVTNDSCVIGPGNNIGLSASNTVTVTGAGSVWHCRTGLVVGVLGHASQVVISDSGLLRTDNGFYIGSSSNGNSIVVSGAGSLWSVGVPSVDSYVGGDGSDNQVIVTNGGWVRTESNNPITIGATSGSNNVVRVTGPGSLLVTTNGNSSINVGGAFSSVATRSRLVVENGGQAFVRTITVGPGGSSSNHEVSVSGPGSLLSAAGLFRVALGSSGNHLSISNGGMVIAQGLFFVGNSSASGQLTVSDASLVVTNAAGNNPLRMNRGTNIFDGGTIVTDQLQITNGVVGALLFKRGTLRSANSAVANGLPFVVGDGVNAATFQLPGGIHTFSNGLIISSNAILQGCGTISGGVILQPGGTVQSDCTNLVFTGTVTNHGTLRALNGSTLLAQGLVVSQGVIDIIEGTTNFLGGFINNGIVLTSADVRISEVSVSGNDVAVKLPSFSGHTFQLQRRDSLATGSWTNLGATQAGTGGILTFTDTGSMTNAPEHFYRIRIVP